MGLTFTKRRRRINILGWPTDVISIDPKPNGDSCDRDVRSLLVHTVIFWIPGNPGQYNWYNSDFMDVLSGLGEGYALRSVSHAGHGLFGTGKGDYGNNDDNSITDVKEHCRFGGNRDVTGSACPLVPWTVEGQVLHKIAYIDSLLSSIGKKNYRYKTFAQNQHAHKNEQNFEFSKDLKLILIGHSFGCHIIQRMCVLRPDILERVSGYLFLMPYIRTKPSSPMDQRKLDFSGSLDELPIAVGTKLSRIVSSFPDSMVRNLIRKGLRDGSDSDGNGFFDGANETIVNVTASLLANSVYPRNFFELGLEEIRDIPNEIDVVAFRLLSSYRTRLSQKIELRKQQQQQQHRPIFILYAGDNDQWCPSFHGEEIKALQSANLLPRSIRTTKMSGLRHDYVCLSRSKRARVNHWIISNISNGIKNVVIPRNDITADHSVSRNHNNTAVDGGFSTSVPKRPKLPSKL